MKKSNPLGIIVVIAITIVAVFFYSMYQITQTVSRVADSQGDTNKAVGELQNRVQNSESSINQLANHLSNQKALQPVKEKTSVYDRTSLGFKPDIA